MDYFMAEADEIVGPRRDVCWSEVDGRGAGLARRAEPALAYRTPRQLVERGAYQEATLAAILGILPGPWTAPQKVLWLAAPNVHLDGRKPATFYLTRPFRVANAALARRPDRRLLEAFVPGLVG